MGNIPSRLLLQIVTPERSVVLDEVDEILLPGTMGYLGVLPGHTPLLTSLKIGEIKYRKGGKTRYLCVSWGFAEILPDKVTVLADLAEAPEEIDIEAARETKDRAMRALRNTDGDFNVQVAALEQALVRLQVASKAAPETPKRY